MGLLSQKGIPHVEIWDRSMVHRWDSGWLPLAVASLFRQIHDAGGNQNKK
jgi:hypothetical protein